MQEPARGRPDRTWLFRPQFLLRLPIRTSSLWCVCVCVCRSSPVKETYLISSYQ